MFVTRCVEKYETNISLHCFEPNPPKNQNKTKNKTKRNHCFVLRQFNIKITTISKDRVLGD